MNYFDIVKSRVKKNRMELSYRPDLQHPSPLGGGGMYHLLRHILRVLRGRQGTLTDIVLLSR